MKQTPYNNRKSAKNFYDSKGKYLQHDLQQEIYSLEAQILDMFEVSFYFAGIDLEHLPKALKCYMELLDNEESQEYTAKNIISLIEKIRLDKPEWFKNNSKIY